MVVFIDRHKHFADRPEINEYMIERKWIILRSTCGEVESSSSSTTRIKLHFRTFKLLFNINSK